MIQGLVRLVLVALLVTRGLVQPYRLDAQLAPSTPFGEALQRIVASNRHTAQRWPQLSDVTVDLRTAYTANGWTPLWTQGGRPTSSALATIAQLNRIDTRGLDPSDYDVERLSELVRTLVAGAAFSTEAAAVEFDVMVSTAALRSLRSLQYGRVSARVAHADLRFAHEPWDAAAALRELATSADAAQQFAAAEPPYQHYRLLVDALARYRALASDTVQLRLALQDTMRKRGSPESMSTLQRRLEARVVQITTTLERWRWLPHRFTVPPIIVNIPAFELFAFRSANERDVLRMNVVVGKAYNHKTPVFSGAVQYLIFSPYWDVPPSITRKEVLPKARKNIDYLTRNEFEIVGSNEQVMPTTYAALDAVSAGRARIRQRPGAQNALGGVKFIFPNEFNVYMHDTPAQALFGEVRRDFSHGCIRLSRPAELAALLLRDQAGWDSTHIAALMHRTTPMQVRLTAPVPVHVVYATVVARDDGSVAFHDDIYGHDRRLSALLKGGYPYSAPDRRP
ncbi:L,D-transpeptidase family protein [Gemmatimonas sp.]|uniref:L,D-transpeptidase family protein n=1 Tax=Gemmatimonas sp. TaxID=1962908 RepID=UPI00286A3A6B|nr:L,D-transpeptidase family protein [Gemmatimonas sp.]